MLQKPLTGLLLLAGAAGGPYLWYETQLGNTGRSLWSSATDGSSSGQTESKTDSWLNVHPAGMPSAAADPFNPSGRSLDQTPVVQLAEVLRFDVSPEWVMSRFPRVSTLLSEMNLDGLRAPLITGSTPTDLAGTLTYYFDHYKRVKRITVHASVGDPSRFVMELQQGYHMSQEPSLGGSLFVTKWNGKPTNLLHVAPASVVYNDLAYARYNLFLELNQADLEYGLSADARQLVEAGKQTQRW